MKARTILMGLGYLVVAAIPLFPLYWLLISAVKGPEEFRAIPATWWPQAPSFEPFRQALEVLPFERGILNSFLIAGVSTASVVLTSLLAGYAFAKVPFRYKDTIFWSVIATMFIPPIIFLVPLYWIIQTMGLSNSFLGVILPWLANAFGIFLMRQFISEVPDELLDAARMDGASELRILFRIVTPLVTPATIALMVFAFVYYWNNFLWPLSVLQSEEKFPVVLMLSRLLSYNTSIQFQNVVLAGALIASIPTLLVFFLTQRFFVQGIAASGLKS